VNTILVIVTDLGLFKAYSGRLTPKHTPHLEPLEEVVLEETHHRITERVTDMAGRHSAPTNKSWGAPLTDDHGLRLETERRIIKQIAKHIERLIERTGHDGCWLAAHKEINHAILEELPKTVRDRIRKNLPRDLTKVGPEELLEHFPEVETQKTTSTH